MDAEYVRELRMRCIEAAAGARAWYPADGPDTGVVKTATRWFDWVSIGKASTSGTLDLPKKAPL